MAADKKTTEVAEGIIHRPLTLGVYNVKINVQVFGMCACVERGGGSQLDVAIPKEDKQAWHVFSSSFFDVSQANKTHAKCTLPGNTQNRTSYGLVHHWHGHTNNL